MNKIFNTHLTPEESDYLEHYKITTRDQSIINNKINIPYLFTPLNKILPKWIVPNMITLTGNFVPIIVYLLTVIVEPDFTKPVPSWLCVLMSFAILMFFLCDSIDGMRARSSGVCSPIGDWLDHSMDNITYFCFVAYFDHMFCTGNLLTMMAIVLSMVYTSYFVQIEAIFTHTINLGIINASCEGLMAVTLVPIFNIFVPLKDITIFGIPFIYPVIVGTSTLLLSHCLTMTMALKEQFPNQPEILKKAFVMFGNGVVCIIVGLVFYYVFAGEYTPYNYMFTNLWIYFSSLVYVNMIIQARLFNRKHPRIWDVKSIVCLVLPFVLIVFVGYQTAIIISAVVSGIIMWTDWVCTIKAMLNALGLRLFQTEPTRFAPKKK